MAVVGMSGEAQGLALREFLLPMWGEQAPTSPQQAEDALPRQGELDAVGPACFLLFQGSLVAEWCRESLGYPCKEKGSQELA